MKDDPNMMLVWYEDMLEDLPKVIREVCKFLGKSLTEEEISRLSDSLQIDNFRLLESNKNANYNVFKRDYCRKMQVDERVTKEDKETFTKFFRKGKVGGSQIALPYYY